MEPISTLVLAAAFLAPAALTRRLIWETTPRLSSEANHADEKLTLIALLPGVTKSATSDLIHQIDASPALSTREQLKRETKSYSSLVAGWAGINSVVPSPSAMHIALGLIDSFPARLPLPRPMLSSDGELAFYWDLQHGYAELGIDKVGSVTFFSRASGGQERFEEQLSILGMSQSWFWEAIGHLDTTLKAAA